ncbi:MAG: hypothetical protein QOE70_6715 [Chthoniobacter sp.]|jgi:hypothetical protein|nr:hypothetical protein [Chthoniobacter sp.]
MHLIKAAMPKPNHRVFVKRLEDGWYVFAAGGRYNIPLEKHEATERALSEARLLSLAEIGVYDGRDQLLETVPTKRS